jgi:hypothetical protein
MGLLVKLFKQRIQRAAALLTGRAGALAAHDVSPSFFFASNIGGHHGLQVALAALQLALPHARAVQGVKAIASARQRQQD